MFETGRLTGSQGWVRDKSPGE